MPSKGHECEGVLGNGHRCRMSRDGKGHAIRLNKACRVCGEWRCRTHCKCGREGTAHGWQAPRGRVPEAEQPRPKAKARPRSTESRPIPPSEPVYSVVPAGRPAQLDTEVYADAAWWPVLLAEVAEASHVLISVYLYDANDLHSILVRRLRGRSPFALQMLVDKEGYDERTAPRQQPKLLELQTVGAEIFLARGCGRLGRLHSKAVVVNHRVAFVGSANLTEKSKQNHELVCKLRGPPVRKVLDAISAFRIGAVPM